MIAGLKQIAIVGLVLGVIAAGYFTIQWLQDTGKQELKIETLEQNVETRRRIDEAIRTTPTGRDAAIGVLNDFITGN